MSNESRTPADKEVENWIVKLKDLYGAQRYDHYANERETLTVFISKIKSELASNYGGLYKLDEPFKVGGTGVVFKAHHVKTAQPLVLKFNRPNVPPDEMSMVENEMLLLPTLNHSNIIHVVDAGTIASDKAVVKQRISFLVEQFVPDPSTVGGYFDKLLASDTVVSIIAINQALLQLVDILHQWISALKYVHDQGYVYLDVKPDNALVDRDGHLVLIDFGSSKKEGDSLSPTSNKEQMRKEKESMGYFGALSQPSTETVNDPRDEGSTNVYFTLRYAHPILRRLRTNEISSNRVKAGIKRRELRRNFDYYSMGKSILELLNSVAKNRPNDCPQLSLFRSLHFVATRLLDGQNQDSGEENLIARETFGELRQRDYGTILYRDLDAVLRDLEKERGSWNPELRVPEIETYSKDVVRMVPNINTVFTERLENLSKHPLFARLKMTSELGLVSLVYPTADHSRFDHIIGTYTYTASYVKTLFKDNDNPIFRNLVNETDIKAVLLASLLHDLGQYPLAHDLEEVHQGIFSHSKLSRELIDDSLKDEEGRTLTNVIKDDWKVEPSYVKRILGAQEKITLDEREEEGIRDFKVDMLAALIDGPVDADKADYIVRDSMQCRIPYGDQLDIDRLLRVLTVALISDPESLHRVTVGVYAKGRASAEAFGLARYLLFSSVYWHHASRILKSMLQYATVLSLPEEVFDKSGLAEVTRIHEKLRDFACKLLPPFDLLPKFSERDSKRKREIFPADQVPSEQVLDTVPGRESRISNKKDRSLWHPGISWTDWLMLRWLISELPLPNPVSKALIEGIMTRKLYKRVATLPRSEKDQIGQRLDALTWPEKVKLCKMLSAKIRDRVMRSWDDVSTYSTGSKDEVERIFDNRFAILVDVPQTKIGFLPSRPLVFVPELKQKTYYQEIEESHEATDWTQLNTKLMTSIAPVRVLCHPRLLQPISRVLSPVSKEMRIMINKTLAEMA